MKKIWYTIEQLPMLGYVGRWLFLTLLIGAGAGSASAIFLHGLVLVGDIRDSFTWFVLLLPLGGLLIGAAYHYWGKSVQKGNNQILEEWYSPGKAIPFRMLPLVLLGTLITHLFGGSAGREGTAVQMAAAIGDRVHHILKLHKRDRKIILAAGVSAGFASVFGTPLAGAVFALEVFVVGRMRYEALFPCFAAAIVGDIVCHLWQAEHTIYNVGILPPLNAEIFIGVAVIGIAAGIVALLFAKSVHVVEHISRRWVQYPPMRPVLGGIVFAVVILAFGAEDYMGLGIPRIVAAFEQQAPWYEFLLKILFTAWTLGVGFKGGEVTPLFFIGATLGSASSFFLPITPEVGAAIGFVAVFAGATNTPLACTFMAIELFGASAGIYCGLGCVLAYLFSGHTGIYSSQIIGSPKHLLYTRLKGKSLQSISSRTAK